MLEDISFSIAPAEIVALVGPSGSGKTLTLQAIVQLHSHLGPIQQSGQILLSDGNGKTTELTTSSSLEVVRRNHIGLIFQQSKKVLNPSQTISAQLMEKMKDGSPQNQMATAHSLLEEVQLVPGKQYAKAYPHQLSGGQLQRVMIALALVNSPSLVLADEPFSALDDETKSSLLLLFKQLSDQRKIALLVVSHDLKSIREMADRIIHIADGKIQDRPSAHATEVIGNKNSGEGPLLMKVSALTKAYAKGNTLLSHNQSDHAVFDGFDLKIHKGECVGIYGASGSGKSTLARLLMGLESADSGSILFKGQALNEMSPAQRKSLRTKAQIIFQDPLSAMAPHRVVNDLYKDAFLVMKEPYDQGKIAELWSRMDLELGLLERRPRQLSGGQRQRILIARALLLGAELLICDEILASLDTAVGEKILAYLMQLQQERDLTLVLISHDLEILKKCCNRLIEI